jgi:hypothetical protein
MPEDKLIEAVIAVRYANGKLNEYRLTRDAEGWWLVTINTGTNQNVGSKFTREFRSRGDVQRKVLGLVKNMLKSLEEPADRLGL